METRLPADLLIENVTVLTMNPLHPSAHGVAVANGKIIGLLQQEQSWPLAVNGIRIDGKGLTLFPGLIDAHCHLRAQISQFPSVSCGADTVKNIQDIIQAIRQQADSLPEGIWIRASGYDISSLTEQRHPTRHDLDQATTSHPIRLRHVTRHVSVLNSLALELAGITRETIDPPGVYVERDALTGIPTGVIFGGDAWLSRDIIPRLNKGELMRGAAQLQSQLLHSGITAVQDATPSNSLEDLKFWAARLDEDWPISIQFMTGLNDRHLIADYVGALPEIHAGKLELGHCKIVMEPLPELHPDLEELSRLAREATRQDIPLAIHVVDPEMTWTAIEAIRHSKEIFPHKQLRHRLEHLSLCPDAFLPDMAKLGITVVTNPSLIYDHGNRYLADVDPTEHDWLYRMNSLRTIGVPLAAGSDAPVASVNPWIGMQAACTRSTKTGNLIGVAEKLNRWEALKLYTSGAAYAAGWEKTRGIIAPSYQADFLLIDQNPLTCEADELGMIDVCAVWIAGKLVHGSL
ncbi:amidohydrolase [Sporosarcina sp. 179-K 3D1 HS]|uniref:amidohydrolase n=1 Tax=Sporosarcina sp. 179-K 3D1 HS TaxID=3232169 RepID=UPI0039A33B19